MVIDFERAETAEPRTVLGVIPVNRKRKREAEGDLGKQQGGGSVFSRELQRAKMELRSLA